MKTYLFIFLLFYSITAYSQPDSLPYLQSFESPFVQGTAVEFLTSLQGNEVSTSSRIYQSNEAYEGNFALAAEPTSSFTAEIILSLDLSNYSGACLNFHAKGVQNGSSGSSRPAILELSTSLDQGETYNTPEIIDHFTNHDSNRYALYTYCLPPSTAYQSAVRVRFRISRGEGSGSAARFLMDELLIEAQSGAFPLTISQTEVENDRQLRITFNQEVTEEAENEANYRIEPDIGQPHQISRLSPRLVLAEFSTEFLNQNYTLQIENITSLDAPDSLYTLQHAFSHETSTPYGAVVIHEIMADPNPKGDLLPDSLVLPQNSNNEFVELYNTLPQSLNIEGFRLNNGTIGPCNLEGNGYVILCTSEDSARFAAFGAVAVVDNWNTLSNGGEQLVLKNNLGEITDSLSYDRSWYRNEAKTAGGWSLEQRKAAAPCQEAENWSASVNPKGASPGASNSISTLPGDTLPPAVDTIMVIDRLTVNIRFSESLLPDSIRSDDFQVNNHQVHKAILQGDYKHLQLQLTNSLPSDTSNVLVINQLYDCQGNHLENLRLDFTTDFSAAELHAFSVIDWNQMELTFSEAVQPQAENVLLLPDSLPVKATEQLDQRTLKLTFETDFKEDHTYKLLIEGIKDKYGNPADFERHFTFINQIDSLYAANPQLLVLKVKGLAGKASAENASHYSLEGEQLQASRARMNPENPLEIFISFEAPFAENKFHRLIIRNLKDTLGQPFICPVTEFMYDSRPPKLKEQKLLSDYRLMLVFNEKLEEEAAEALQHYQLDQTTFPTTVYWQDTAVVLEFTQAFEDEKLYRLSIEDLKDISGNKLKRKIYTDIYSDSLPPVLEKLTVSAPDKLNIRFHEVVEDSLALATDNYKISDVIPQTIEKLTETQYCLKFGEAFGEKDSIRLVIDQISDPYGNTSKNLSRAFSTIYPSLAALQVLSPTELRLRFSEPLLKASAENKANFELAAEQIPLSSQQDSADLSVVLLEFAQEFTEKLSQSLTIRGLEDLHGNRLQDSIKVNFSYDPGLRQIKATGKNQLELSFEQAIRKEAAETAGNFLLNNMAPLLALHHAEEAEKVTLVFGEGLKFNNPYRLKIKPLALDTPGLLPASAHTFVLDRHPPKINAFQALDHQLWITFDQAIDQQSAEIKEHYRLDDNLFPIETEQLTARQLRLEFDEAFEALQHYRLKIQGIKDLSGNRMAEDTLFFTYQPLPTPAFRDIVINELLPDPSTAGEAPGAEFVEIFNASALSFNLKNMTLSDASQSSSLPWYELSAGEHLVLYRKNDSSHFQHIRNKIGLENWPSLNNSGENLRLADRYGRLVDQMYYENSQRDHSLEQLNPYTSCFSMQNWHLSAGATAGEQNKAFSLKADSLPPELVQSQVLSSRLLSLKFNETLDTSSIRPEDFHFQNLRLEKIEIYSERELRFWFADSLLPSLNYQLIIESLSDCSGQKLQAYRITFSRGVQPAFNELLITEVMSSPASDGILPASEYLELYNPTNKTIRLNKFKLVVGTDTLVLPPKNLQPKEYLILCPKKAGEEFQSIASSLSLSPWPALNNKEEFLALYNQQNEAVFQLTYTDTWYGEEKNSGRSLEMVDVLNPCKESGNWKVCRVKEKGTPGAVNSVAASNPDHFGPQLLEVMAVSDTLLHLYFDEKLRPNQAGLTEAFLLSGKIEIQSAKVHPRNMKLLKLTLMRPLKDEQLYHINLKAKKITDCPGNFSQASAQFTFALPQPADSLDVVINEVLFNPRSGGNRFIELYNRSSKYIDLKGWQMGIYEDPEIKGLEPLTSKHEILAPGNYLLITEAPDVVKADYPRALNPLMIKTERLPTMNNQQGTLVLVNADQKPIDHMTYDEKQHHPLLDDTEGVSLERISPEAPSQETDSWQSATQEVGFATPAYINSQYEHFNVDKGEIRVHPKVQTDLYGGITILYRFPKAGFMANVKVFDPKGRLIRQLAQNRFLSQQGSIYWDSTNQVQKAVKTTYYLIWFEVFDLNGKTKIYKETVVLAPKN